MLRRSYFVKPGYKIREKNSPFPDIQHTGTVYQPHVYEFAKYLLEKSKKKYLIDIGAGSGEKLKSISKKTNIIAMDCSTNINLLKKNLPDAKVILYDFEKGLPEIDPKVLSNSVVISVDVIEHIVEPHKYLKALQKISKIAPYVLLSTPDRTRARGAEDFGPPGNPFHVREWTIDELNRLLNKYGIKHNIGFTVSNNIDNYKGTIIAISGQESVFTVSPPKSVMAVMTSYNEEDIIESSIQHLLNQGVDVHIIDNWSTDGTYKIISQLGINNPRITYERFPKVKPKKHQYEWKKLLQKVEQVGHKSKYDWIIHNDSDEHRISPWRGVSLQQAISFVDDLGYSAIDFTVTDFRPIKDGFSSKTKPEEFFYDFEFTGIGGYFQQIKGWKNTGKVDLATSGGHDARFESQKVYPIKFLSKHYPLRSSKQAYKKIFKERKKHFVAQERSMGWHTQYDDYKESDSWMWDSKCLNRYTEGNFYNEYIIERLSGVGIKRTNTTKKN